jgi:hypothetical protein
LPSSTRSWGISRQGRRPDDVPEVLYGLADPVRIQVRDPRGDRVAFGDKVKFDGRWHGIITLIVVIIVMLIAEELIVRIYRKLGNGAN